MALLKFQCHVCDGLFCKAELYELSSEEVCCLGCQARLMGKETTDLEGYLQRREAEDKNDADAPEDIAAAALTSNFKNRNTCKLIVNFTQTAHRMARRHQIDQMQESKLEKVRNFVERLGLRTKSPKYEDETEDEYVMRLCEWNEFGFFDLDSDSDTTTFEETLPQSAKTSQLICDMSARGDPERSRVDSDVLIRRQEKMRSMLEDDDNIDDSQKELSEPVNAFKPITSLLVPKKRPRPPRVPPPQHLLEEDEEEELFEEIVKLVDMVVKAERKAKKRPRPPQYPPPQHLLESFESAA